MLIGLVGRMGSGKGTVAEILKEQGFSSAIISDFIIKEMKERGIAIILENIQDVGDEARKKYGGGEWVKRILKEMDLDKNYIFDGVRNPGEVEELRKTGKFFLIYVDCMQHIRWPRVKDSGKEKNPKIWEEFLIAEKRDSGLNQPEYGQQVDKCIQKADFVITNNYALENLKRQVLDILNKIKC